MALAKSKTLLCKLTLRVCIAGSEQENGGESRQEERGEKDVEKEEIKRQRAVRDIKRGESVNRRKGIMNRGGRSEK